MSDQDNKNKKFYSLIPISWIKILNYNNKDTILPYQQQWIWKIH